MLIHDGEGSSRLAGVDSKNRLKTLSVSESRFADISRQEGLGFLIATGFISLTTTGSFNGIVYIKNTSAEAKDLLIGKIRTCSDASGTMRVKTIKNPTAGTLISDANSATVNSANFGSSQTFGGLAYSASGDGKTVTDGSDASQYINHSPGHSIQEYDGLLVIPKGSSFALVVQPSAATTFCAEIQAWFE